MKKLLVCVMGALTMLLGGCDGGEASCAVCGQSYSDEQCMQIATEYGCTSGASFADEICGGGTRGCQLQGCPTGVRVMCSAPPVDGGM